MNFLDVLGWGTLGLSILAFGLVLYGVYERRNWSKR